MQKLEGLIQQEYAEMRQCLSSLRQFKLQPDVHPRVLQELERQNGIAEMQAQANASRLDELQGPQRLKHLEFARDATAIGVEIAKLLAPAVLAVRAELELVIDEAEYRKMFEESAQLALQTTQEMLGRLRALEAGQAPGGGATATP
jgi:hypothetical protein